MTRNTSTPDESVRLRTLTALFAALVLVVLPHAGRLPAWVAPALVLVGVWRYLAAARGMPLPSRWLLPPLTGVGVLAALIGSRHPFGRDMFLGLLATLVGLKLLEMRARRDFFVVAFLCAFLVVTNFLYDQSIPMAACMVMAAVLVTFVLVDLADEGGSRPLASNLRLSLRLLAHALPLLVVLFFLFPRVPGPLWGISPDVHRGVSGLSDAMWPGSVRQVSLSDAVAFRVKFEGEIPPPSHRYWRGPVFEYTDGVRWTSGPRPEELARGSGEASVSPEALARVRLGADAVDYTVTLEPHGERWLFALDLPSPEPEAGVMTREFLLRSHRPVRERLRYSVESRLQYNTGELDEAARASALQVPGVSPRVRALADRWRVPRSEGWETVKRALSHFRQEPFVYTLSPPMLGADPVDEFLFETRRGFCEHYAASFTLLMRLAGVPARVVTGYQGAEHNPVGDYLIVRQAHAHAWSEVWLPDRGWVRLDPTAAVAPERVELTVDIGAAASDTVRFVVPASGPLADGLRGLRHLWDSVNNGWNQWVLGYGPKRQADFLARLGFQGATWRGMTAFLTAILALILGTLAVRMARAESAREDPSLRQYRRYCRKLARRGLTRLPHEGPLVYAQRVLRQRPDLAADVVGITDLYVRLRYAAPQAGPEAPGTDLGSLREKVSRFRP